MDTSRVPDPKPDEYLAAIAFEDLMPVAAVIDGEGSITLVNRAWRRYAEAYSRGAHDNHFVGTNYLQVCEGARGRGQDYAIRMADGMRTVLAGENQEFRLLYPCREHDGQKWYVAWVTRLSGGVGAVVTHLDVTEEGVALERLDRLGSLVGDIEQLEQFGLRARSVAHDLRNSLTLIMGKGQVALESLDRNDPAVGDIEGMIEASRKAAAFCSQMMRLRSREAPSSLVAINEVVEDTMHDVEAIMPEHISIDLRLDQRVPMVNGESAQLHQVLVNLLVNAIQALDETPGAIHLETGIAFRERESFSPVGGLEPPDTGQYVYVYVSDTGPGIPEDMRERIFSPFFTTKKQGTGLGLSSAVRTLKAHSSVMEVDSTPGKGSTFSIWLPFLDPEE